MSSEYFSFPKSYYFSWLNVILKGTAWLSSWVFFHCRQIVIPECHELPDLFMGEKYWYLFQDLLFFLNTASSLYFSF